MPSSELIRRCYSDNHSKAITAMILGISPSMVEVRLKVDDKMPAHYENKGCEYHKNKCIDRKNENNSCPYPICIEDWTTQGDNFRRGDFPRDMRVIKLSYKYRPYSICRRLEISLKEVNKILERAKEKGLIGGD